MILKKAENEFKTNKYLYEVVERKGDIALLKQMHPVTKEIVMYEVHKLQIVKVPEIFKKSENYAAYTNFEKYASNEQFGTYGWSYPNYEIAKNAFESACQNAEFTKSEA